MPRPLRAALLLLTAALTLTACAATPKTTAAAKRSPPPAASAVAVPSPSAPPDPWATWCGSPAYVDNQMAVGDANAVNQDIASSDLTSAATDGLTLEQDALKAGAELPPAGRNTRLNYGLYFGWLAIVGKDVAAGDMAAANSAAVKVVKFRGAVQRVDAQCTALGD